jgi:glycosyltransferase involved in cell wall biosynthesis
LTGTDPESIRGAIRRLLSDGALRERLAAAGRTYALTHYALDRVAEQEASLLREVVQEHDRGKVIP